MNSAFLRVALGALLLGCSVARADQTAQNLRNVGQKYGAALVSVELTISFNSSPEPMELTTTGAVIDASGLIALSYTAVDPYSLVGSASGEEIVSNVKSAKVLLGGREIPARVVLRDKDRNLAFLRPLRPLGVAPLPFASAGAQNAQALPGDEVALLGRLGKAGNREISLEPARINAVLTRPRRLFLLPNALLSHLGEVAFSSKGQLLGLVGVRVLPGASRARTIDRSDSLVPAITPAADIWALSRKVPPLKK